MNEQAGVNAEKRTLTVSPSIIMHLINSQAGSCAKAVTECVMNSVDAGAKRVTIDLSREQMIIADDGVGFQSREEILSMFEVFGFDHEGMDRTFGKFGLGRGQLWKFASTKWRTNSFEMDVDIRSKGLDYVLVDNAEPVKGLSITASFYTPLTAVEETELLREVEDLCKYAVIPVIVNGKQINKDPATEKWGVETDEAYLRVNDAYGLKVYNQGIFVCEVPSRHVGVSGVLCTKLGHNLELNMARNDVERDSPLWKRLIALCKKMADSKIKKVRRGRLTESERAYLAAEVYDPSKTMANLVQPIFTLTDGRHVNVVTLYERVMSLSHRTSAITVAEPGSRIGERMQRERSAVVLSSKTLARFSVDGVAALFAKLASILPDADPLPEDQQPTTGRGRSSYWRLRLSDVRHVQGAMQDLQRKAVEDITTLPSYKAIESQAIPDKELTEEMRLYLVEVRKLAESVNLQMRYFSDWGPLAHRKIVAADSQDCEAYTDGQSFIAVVRSTMEKAMKAGYPGMLMIAHLLVHEYLHSESDVGSHQHDLDFYETFHNILLERGERIHEAAMACFLNYAKRLEKRTIKLSKHIDKVEAATKHGEELAAQLA